MVEKKSKKTSAKKTKTESKSAKKSKPAKTQSKSKSKKSKNKEEPIEDSGLVIVEDDLQVDKEKENEERRAYLEEARSQESFDD
ncbi:MAG: hypothetical protein DWQ18_04505 [Crenarchaeota archaeon]|nr:MAG: hypothetical protein DWQ17_08625 [Thermoproteota archaeon]RDJ34162.1 MAG: hypothetical protein DWQ18_04505 [Thermoproteota archaeon]RDJ36723.1 MAG: hypothetical protein DWQ13_06105 [Thermoproteota archaeon]RDJ37744.1 MAG: hypothetical protein DWQ19_04730 [Thermoproteota archaeon]